MSYDLDGRLKQDNRIKINNVIIPSGGGQDFVRCPVCIGKPRLEVRKDANGNRIGVCIRSCNNTYPLEEQTTNSSSVNAKYQTKYGASGKQHSFIISKDNKKKKLPSELSAEDVQDLATLGSTGQGARIVDSQTTYTDEQGARY